MVELDCPMCEEAMLLAFDAPRLQCADCAISVEIDAVRAERLLVLPAAA